MFKHKAAGRRLTQVTAFDGVEAAAAAEQNVDTLTIDCRTIEEIRAVAPHIFVTAAQDTRQYVTEDEALGGAIDTMAKGADAIYSPRGLRTIERVAHEGLSVQGHTGLFPARATHMGGGRAIGQTSEEALRLLEDFRRLEDAGVYSAEVDCIAEDALAELKKHTKLILVTIGAGSSGDIILSYMSDLCGDTPHPPRHAKAFGDVGAIRAELELFHIYAPRYAELGIPFHIRSPEEVAELHPFLDVSQIFGAAHTPTDGHLDPTGTTNALAQVARQLGASIERHRPVSAIHKVEAKWVLETANGTVTA